MKAFCSLTSLGLLVQTVQPVPGSMVDAAGRLTLDAVLVAGVVALWKALAAKDQRIAEKDAQLVAMTSKVTEVMTQVLDAVKELRVAVNDLRDEAGLLKKQ
jgi:hypothetical protein